MNPAKITQFTILGKLLYKLIFRKLLRKAVANTENTIDDRAFKMIDEMAFGKKG
jgi:hypothetical protein